MGGRKDPLTRGVSGTSQASRELSSWRRVSSPWHTSPRNRSRSWVGSSTACRNKPFNLIPSLRSHDSGCRIIRLASLVATKPPPHGFPYDGDGRHAQRFRSFFDRTAAKIAHLYDLAFSLVKGC